MALAQDRTVRERESAVHTEAAVAAALANQTSQVQALRRPDLPPFDKDHIEVWIRRIEFAYARSNIVKPTDKFAFLEKMFHAKDDSRINAFMWGTHTNATWNEFITYLKERYGRTVKQEVQTLLEGVPREGRRPTALAELIKELTPRVTIDDVRKEILLKQMPASVRQHLNDKLDDLDFEEMAIACDKHFDQNGKLKESGSASAVNHISNLRQPRPQQHQQHPQQQQTPSTSSFTNPFPAQDDLETDVNAVRFRDGQRRDYNIQNRSSSRGRSSGSSSNSSSNGSNFRGGNSSSNRAGGASSSSNSSSNPPPTRQKKVCSFHIRFGEQAENCEGPWCILKNKIAPKGQASR